MLATARGAFLNTAAADDFAFHYLHQNIVYMVEKRTPLHVRQASLREMLLMVADEVLVNEYLELAARGAELTKPELVRFGQLAGLINQLLYKSEKASKNEEDK